VPWAIGEDTLVEFSGGPSDAATQRRVLFWIDLLPVDPGGRVTTGVPSTAAGLVGWLVHRPNLTVSQPHTATLGAAHLPAQVVDISIPDTGTSEDPGCPASNCAAFLTWPNKGREIYGMANPQVLRLYLTDVSWKGQRHVFAAAIEANDAAALRAFATTAQHVIDSAQAALTAP